MILICSGRLLFGEVEVYFSGREDVVVVFDDDDENAD